MIKRIQNCADYMNLAGQFYFKNGITHNYGLFTRVLNIKFFVMVKFKILGK